MAEEQLTLAIVDRHEEAVDLVHRLHREVAVPYGNLSIVGRDFSETEEIQGVWTWKDAAADGAAVGAVGGGLFGLLMGGAVLVVPGIGPIIVAGSLAAWLLGVAEGVLVGAGGGGLVGALIGGGLSREEALRVHSDLKAGRFAVVVHGPSELVEKARAVLPDGPKEG